VQCAVTVSKSAMQPDADADADAADGDDITDEVCDNWQMDSLSPPPAFLQPLKYPAVHIFVSCYIILLDLAE